MGRVHAIIIGVEKYQDSDLRRVLFAEKDAHAVASALGAVGCPAKNQLLLLNEQATKTAIEFEIRNRLVNLASDEKCFVFFAGHGYSDGSHNYLAAHDTRIQDLEGTSVRLQKILAFMKASPCKQLVFFLDACHVGVKVEETLRSEVTGLLEDRRDQYCLGFASCRSDQKSYSSKKLEHGIWTYHLLQALSGHASAALDGGNVTPAKLQAYLADAVPRSVLAEFEKPRPQTPRFFGSYESVPIVADVSALIAERLSVNAAEQASLKRVAFFSTERGRVQSMSGFDKKRGHFVPDYVSGRTNDFVRSLAGPELEEHIEDTVQQLSKKLKVKRKDIEPTVDSGVGSIRTPAFDYNVYVGQDQDDPGMYLWRYELVEIRDPSVLQNPAFNEIFSDRFDTVELTFDGHSPDIEELVSQLEDAGHDPDAPLDMSSCTVSVPGCDAKIRITAGSIELHFKAALPPLELANGFRAAYATLAGEPALAGLLTS